MRSAWLSLGFVVSATASCDFPRLSSLTTDAGTLDTNDGPDATVAKQCTPVPGLADDFSGAMNAALWETIADPNVVVSQASGLKVKLAANQTGAAYGGYASLGDRDFREHCVYVTFATIPTAAATSDMTIQFVTSTSVGFNVRNGKLVVYFNNGNYTPITSVNYDPVAHHVLRLRETGGTLFWETSADGATFTGLYSEPDRIDLSSIGIRLEAGTFAAQANPGTAVFTNFDTP
jgi:hypothetical protein